MTTTDQANTTVITSLAVAGALILVRDAHDGTVPGARVIVGLVFTGVGLGTLAQFAPKLASSFGLLLLTSAVFVYGGPALTAIAATTTRPTPIRKAQP